MEWYSFRQYDKAKKSQDFEFCDFFVLEDKTRHSEDDEGGER